MTKRVIVLALITIASCSANPKAIHDSQAGLMSCDAWPHRNNVRAVLRAEFDSSGPALVHWELTRYGPKGPSAVDQFTNKHAKDARIYVCYFDGTFAGSKPAPAPPATVDPYPYNRLRVFVSTPGESWAEAYGYHDTPGHGPGQGQLDLLRPVGNNP